MKCPTVNVNSWRIVVTPYGGVWIEIRHGLHRIKTSLVTPYGGVWIEINNSSNVRVFSPVTPYGGVWIEISVH